MVLFVLAYFGGVLTIVSPCILPVLPFVFARADRPFVRSGVPMLVGMAVTFAVVATLAAVAGGWAVKANQYGGAAAIMLLAMFGLTHWIETDDPAILSFDAREVPRRRRARKLQAFYRSPLKRCLGSETAMLLRKVWGEPRRTVTTRYPSRHSSPGARRFLFVIKGFSNIGSRRMTRS
jgi:hypothetical protein